MADPLTTEEGGWRTGRLDMRTLAPDAFSEEQVYAHYLYPPNGVELPNGRIAFYGIAGTGTDPRLVSQQVADLLNHERTARQRAERERDEARRDASEGWREHERMMAERNATTAELEAEQSRAAALLALAEELVRWARFYGDTAAIGGESALARYESRLAALKGDG